MAFDPDAFLASTPAPGAAFDPDAFLAKGPASTSFKVRGQRQEDGTWLVPTPDGPVRLDDEGNPVDGTREAKAVDALNASDGGSKGFHESSGLSKALAFTKGASLGAVNLLADEKGKKTVAEAGEAHPGYDIAGGILTTLPVGGAGTVAGRIGLSGAVGAAQSAAESGGDVAKTLEGGALGLGAGALGEGLAYGIGKATGKLKEVGAKAFAAQAAKDAAAVDKEIASAAGKLGNETAQTLRIRQNAQQALQGVPPDFAFDAAKLTGSEAHQAARDLLHNPEMQATFEHALGRNVADGPGQMAAMQSAAAELDRLQVAKVAGEAAKRTEDYFAQPLWQTEIYPRIKRVLAPRFGMAAVAMATGAVTGKEDIGAGMAGGILGAPGMKAMLGNLIKSNRVQYALGQRLAPLMATAGQAIARGIVPTARELAVHTLDESALGDSQLVAEQLAARGGLGATLGKHPPDVAEAAGLNAPQTPLDAAIHRTVGVVTLASALDDSHRRTEKALASWFAGDKAPAEEKGKLPKDVHALAASPEALLDRANANLGSLAQVAPAVHAQAVAVAQRQAQHLAQVAAVPPPAGPLAPAWQPSKAEQAKVANAAALLNEPSLLIRRAHAGTLTAEDMAHVQAVYPLHARAIADAALDAALEAKASGKALPSRTRLMLGLLAGADVDGQQASIARNQAAVAQQSVKPSSQGAPGSSGKSTQTGLGKLSLGLRMAPGRPQEE
jgi:hypothetical protein